MMLYREHFTMYLQFPELVNKKLVYIDQSV